LVISGGKRAPPKKKAKAFAFKKKKTAPFLGTNSLGEKRRSNSSPKKDRCVPADEKGEKKKKPKSHKLLGTIRGTNPGKALLRNLQSQREKKEKWPAQHGRPRGEREARRSALKGKAPVSNRLGKGERDAKNLGKFCGEKKREERKEYAGCGASEEKKRKSLW